MSDLAAEDNEELILAAVEYNNIATFQLEDEISLI